MRPGWMLVAMGLAGFLWTTPVVAEEPTAAGEPTILDSLTWLAGTWHSDQDPQLFISNCGASEGELMLCSEKTLEGGAAVEYGQNAFKLDGEKLTLSISILGETLDVLTMVEFDPTALRWRFANSKYGVLEQIEYQWVDADHFTLELVVEVDQNTQQTSVYDYVRVTEE